MANSKSVFDKSIDRCTTHVCTLALSGMPAIHTNKIGMITIITGLSLFHVPITPLGPLSPGSPLGPVAPFGPDTPGVP